VTYSPIVPTPLEIINALLVPLDILELEKLHALILTNVTEILDLVPQFQIAPTLKVDILVHPAPAVTKATLTPTALSIVSLLALMEVYVQVLTLAIALAPDTMELYVTKISMNVPLEDVTFIPIARIMLELSLALFVIMDGLDTETLDALLIVILLALMEDAVNLMSVSVKLDGKDKDVTKNLEELEAQVLLLEV